MAKPLNIQFDQTRAFNAGDYLKLNIDTAEQADRIHVWGGERAQIGYGFGPYGGPGMYGFGRSLGYGQGLYGQGPYGQGIRRGTYQTQNSFVAGDYSVFATSYDARGNQGDASSTVTVRHRPAPPKPASLQISSGDLNWTWSNP